MKLSWIFIFVAPLALAGNRVGNGGDVVDCPTHARLLDFYEADTTEDSKEKDYQKILASRLDALEKVAPKLAGQYRRREMQIREELNFKAGVALVDVDDSLHAFVPKDENCKIKQIAFRQAVPAGGKRFVIDKDLWEKLNAQNKAGLILHEIIYEHFNKVGEEDSRKARKLNAYLFSPDLDKTTSGKFWLMIKELRVPVYP